jgi:ABC-type spermidine/putrescine transport system permease subunit II
VLKRPDTTRREFGWLAIPDGVLIAIGLVAPLAVLIAYSFGRQNPLTQDVSLTGTVRSYRLLFSDLYRPVFLRSLQSSGVCLALCLVIGIPSALAIARAAPRMQRILYLAILLPTFVSFTARIYAWVGLLGGQGEVTRMVRWVTGDDTQLLYRPPGVLAGMATAYLPLFLTPVLVSLLRIPRELTEIAADLGASSWKLTRRVMLPLAMPGILTGSILVVILSLGEFLIPTVLGGGKSLLLGTLLAEQAGGRNKPLGGAIAVSLLVMMVCVAGLAWLLRLVVRRVADRRMGNRPSVARHVAATSTGTSTGTEPSVSWPVMRSGPVRPLPPWLAHRRQRVPALCALIITLITMYGPIVRLCVNAWNSNELGTTWEGLTSRWFRQAWNNEGVRRSLAISLQVAVLSALASVVVGTLSVLALRTLRRSGAAAVRLGGLARVTTPEILIATGAGVLLPLVGIRGGFLTLIALHTCYLTGFVVMLVAARAGQGNQQLEEAAADLGASPARVIRYVVLPDLLPAIASSLLFTAAYSFDNVALSRVSASPRSQTVPLFLVSMVQRNVTPEIDAIAVLMLLLSASLLGLALLISRPHRQPIHEPNR